MLGLFITPFIRPALACRDAPGVLTDIASLLRWFWPTAIMQQQPPNNMLKRLLQSVAHAKKDGQALRTLMAGGSLRCGSCRGPHWDCCLQGALPSRGCPL